MSRGKNISVSRTLEITSVSETIDADGVIHVGEPIVKRFKGRSTTVSLYVKRFQFDDDNKLAELSSASSAIFNFALDQMSDCTGQVLLMVEELAKYSSKLNAKSTVYRAIDELLSKRLICSVSKHRYVVNPYYAAIGSEMDIKDLRKQWDKGFTAHADDVTN